MFQFICFAALFAFARAAPIDEQLLTTEPVMEMRAPPVDDVPPPVMPEMEVRAPAVGIMEAGLQQSTDGAYNFFYRGEDGSFRQESAVIVNPGSKRQHLKITGSYSYFDANGQEVVVHYNADDRGFVPHGNNISQQISAAAKQNSQLPRVQEQQEPQQPQPQPPVVGGVWI
ncbi:endocuticle structural glycoprotein SgAbd-9 [Anastrepha obliqua]|uniref:endocuticle structural glycoprotein SgAbd-9 n=1 Tax=Anastrepha obliqua TaxID=95512 RepID=UPI002409EE30|nr:endocuticle structural glycoprotein SgAbd-9 [Anastrepha obliqua]